ncbi:MAG: transposase [Candidatus Omnitrophica bacterium]|nr:transposase [Candidatus Omnitrophota bacterium]
MPRTKRALYDGVTLHILNRGHNKGVLFKQKRDFCRFREIVKAYLERYKFSIFHYCLMSNHFHLLMQVIKGEDLPHIMQGISQAYANYHKKTYRTTGYLFQGRYKSFLIEKDEYLMGCARYIERNPIRAGIVTDLSKYPWSSYNYYANGKPDDIITTDSIYEGFGKTTQERMKNYIKYVNESNPYEALLEKAIAQFL